MTDQLYCSGCGEPLKDTFVKKGDKIFCGKTNSRATVITK